MGEEFAFLIRSQKLKLWLGWEVKKHISQLEVPMNDIALVYVIDALNYLSHNEPRLVLT